MIPRTQHHTPTPPPPNITHRTPPLSREVNHTSTFTEDVPSQSDITVRARACVNEYNESHKAQ